MQGVIKYERGDGFVKLRDLAEEPPGPAQVKVEVKAAGICGSDLHVYRDTINYNIQTPVVMGHEFSGVVAEKGVPVSSVSEVTSTVSVSAVEASVLASTSERWTWTLSPDW